MSFDNLNALGWTSSLHSALRHIRFNPDTDTLGRITSVERGRAWVQTVAGHRPHAPNGTLAEALRRSEDALAVGDWVVLGAHTAGVEEAPIVALVPRQTQLARRIVGGESRRQIVAANVDRVFIVTSVGADFSPRRIERYLIAIWDGGASPVLVVNKTDLPHARDALAQELEHAAPGVPVAWVSAHEAEGIQALEPWLRPGETLVFVGSSGVGKSTLVNRLLGRDQQPTQEVRTNDETGRHTTTRRELFATPHGALLIDTPGMREFGLWNTEGGVSQVFHDVETLATQCRFRDCTHGNEPGCAVQEAIANGSLEPGRLRNYLQLQRELAWQERRSNEQHLRNEKQRWKNVARSVREKRKIHRRLDLKEF